MLNKAIIDKLNEQINLEFASSNIYLQMSAWCANKGYEGAAAFLRVIRRGTDAVKGPQIGDQGDHAEAAAGCGTDQRTRPAPYRGGRWWSP